MVDDCVVSVGVIGGVKRIVGGHKNGLKNGLQKVGTKLCLQKWLNKFTIIWTPGSRFLFLFLILMSG